MGLFQTIVLKLERGAKLIRSYLPPIELPSGPEPQVLRMESETPLQRMEGEFGDEVGELGTDGPSRSARRVEPARERETLMIEVY